MRTHTLLPCSLSLLQHKPLCDSDVDDHLPDVTQRCHACLHLTKTLTVEEAQDALPLRHTFCVYVMDTSGLNQIIFMIFNNVCWFVLVFGGYFLYGIFLIEPVFVLGHFPE